VVQKYVDQAGRSFSYVHIDHGSRTLGIHFSAFYGGEGRFNPYREHFGGYFHRLKMLGSAKAHDWLFLCDEYGVDGDGTYYTGEKGDFFVERAVRSIIETFLQSGRYDAQRVVLLGSSMGATAALKFGLMVRARGVVAISPHVDLDKCVGLGRAAHIAFIVPDGEPTSATNHPYTRQVSRLLAGFEPGEQLPDLFVQACRDDDGVFNEQAVPLVLGWQAKGGRAWLDARPTGGHTSDWAPRPLLLDIMGRLLESEAPDVAAYQGDPAYKAAPTRVRYRAVRRIVRTLRRPG
jgi:hypothetical protein